MTTEAKVRDSETGRCCPASFWRWRKGLRAEESRGPVEGGKDKEMNLTLDSQHRIPLVIFVLYSIANLIKQSGNG